MSIDAQINAQAPLLRSLLGAAKASTEAMSATVAVLLASPEIDGKAQRTLSKVVTELGAIDAGFQRLAEAMYQAGFGQRDTSGGGGDGH